MSRLQASVCGLLLLTCAQPAASPRDAVRAAVLPAGLKIEIFADGISGARSLAVAEDGTVAVGTTSNGVVLLRDDDADGQPDLKVVLPGLRNPNGVAWQGKDLYIAETSRVLRSTNPVATLAASEPVELQVVIGSLPGHSHHGRRYIDFGPQGGLYVALGVPCNICEPPDPELTATIRRYDLASGTSMTYAYGLRNSVGFDWHRGSGQMWATDNGGDWLGDDLPHDELNLVAVPGQHFGFPFCHQGDLPDAKFGRDRDCSEFAPPILKLGPHVAALGLHFARNTDLLPAHSALVALHGSWNRSERIGYAVMLVETDAAGSEATAYQPFVSGWLQPGGQVLARPVDIAELPDGSLLVSDDANGAVYRISKSS